MSERVISHIFILLGWLYFIQGIPYGIQDKFIPLLMKLQNQSFSSVSFMKLLLLPWLCKGLWAPFIQVIFTSKIWLFLSIIGLSITSAIGSQVSPDNTSSIAVVLFFLNVFTSIQDIIVDGLTINLLYESQLGLGNTLQIVFYKVGSLFGGAGLIYLSNFTSWSSSLLSVSVLYFISSFSSILVPCKVSKSSIGISNSDTRTIQDKVKLIFIEILQTKDLIWLSVYLFIYKMGERGMANNFPLYLIDKGVDAIDMTFWNGLINQSVSIFGSVLSGLLLVNSVRDIYKVLKFHTLLLVLSISFSSFIVVYCEKFSISVNSGDFIYYLSVLSLICQSFHSGIISTAVFTLMMQSSQKLQEQSQATHYSVITSIENMGKLFFATLAGFLIDSIGIELSFMTFAILAGLPYIMLLCK